MEIMLTSEQAARMLGISKATLLKMRKPYSDIPRVKVGKFTRFNYDDIQKFVIVCFSGLSQIVPDSPKSSQIVPDSPTSDGYSFSLKDKNNKEYKLSSVIRVFYHKQYEEMTKETIKPDVKQVKAFNQIIKRLSEQKPEKYNEKYFCALVEFCLQQGIVALSAIVSESMRGSFELSLVKTKCNKPKRPTVADNMEYVNVK